MAFPKGVSGNPSGLPKENKLWRDALIRAVKRRESTDPQALEKLADKLISLAYGGDMSALKEFGDRIDGKSKQQLDVGITGDLAVEHRPVSETHAWLAGQIGVGEARPHSEPVQD